MADTRQPATVELVGANVKGRPSYRLMVILRAPGCTYQLRGPGCSNCGFAHLTTHGRAVSSDDLVAQLQAALEAHADDLERVTQLDIYNSGSFFADQEIPPAARVRLLQLAGSLPHVERVLVESRPELISQQKLAAADAALGDETELEVAIGLESIDEAIREQRINKGFTLRAFERAAERLAAQSMELVVYLLLKPIDTEEYEAVADVIASARYLKQLSTRLSLPTRIALEPAFVVEETPLYEAMVAGRYQPPSLWSVVEVVQAVAPLLPLKVGLSHEGLPADQRPRGCPRCTERLRAALADFNCSQNVAPLAELRCTCRT